MVRGEDWGWRGVFASSEILRDAGMELCLKHWLQIGVRAPRAAIDRREFILCMVKCM